MDLATRKRMEQMVTATLGSGTTMLPRVVAAPPTQALSKAIQEATAKYVAAIKIARREGYRLEIRPSGRALDDVQTDLTLDHSSTPFRNAMTAGLTHRTSIINMLTTKIWDDKITFEELASVLNAHQQKLKEPVLLRKLGPNDIAFEESN